MLNNKPSIILIELATYYKGQEILSIKNNIDINIIFVSEKIESYDLETKSNISHSDLIISVDNITDYSHIFEKIPNNLNIQACISFSSFVVHATASLAKYIGCKGLNLDAANLALNKYLMRKNLINTEIKQPKFIKFDCKNKDHIEIKQGMENIKYPVIIKPAQGSASDLILIANDKNKLINIINNIQSSLHVRYKEFIIEEYIQGELISVEVMSANHNHHCLGITRKTISDRNFIETGGNFPAVYSEEIKHSIYQSAIGALNHIGYDNGASHIEFILHQSEPYLIEINPRLAGCYVASMINYCYDCDIFVEITKSILQKKIEKDKFSKINYYSSLRAILPPNNHKTMLSKVDTTALEGQAELIKLSKKTGEKIQALSNWDRIGFYIVTAPTEQESIEKADQLLTKVKLEFSD